MTTPPDLDAVNLQSATISLSPVGTASQVDPHNKTEGLLSALGTTALVSILLSWAVMVAYFSYFPPVSKEPPQPKVMAVDMMMVGLMIAQMMGFDETKTKPLFDAVHQKLSALREEGIIVIDARQAVVLPPSQVLEPQDLIPNVPEDVIERIREAMKKSQGMAALKRDEDNLCAQKPSVFVSQTMRWRSLTVCLKEKDAANQTSFERL